jgi:hypothetical protein
LSSLLKIQWIEKIDAKAQRGKELREKSLKKPGVSGILGVLGGEIFRFLNS